MFIYLIVNYAFDELHLVRQLCLKLANRSSLIALAWLVASVQQLFNIVDEFFRSHVRLIFEDRRSVRRGREPAGKSSFIRRIQGDRVES